MSDVYVTVQKGDIDINVSLVRIPSIAFPSTIANVLTDHNVAVHNALGINADTVDGEEAADIVTAARVDPLVTKAKIDALGINAAQATVLNTTAKAQAYRVGTQHDIVSGTPTKILLNGENYDPGSNFANYKFTAPVAGYYLCIGTITYISTLADKLYQALLYRNGVDVAKMGTHASIGVTVMVSVNNVIYLTAGQYIELYANHYAGVDTVDIYGDVGETCLTIHLLSV